MNEAAQRECALSGCPRTEAGISAGLRESLIILLESDDKILFPLCLKRKKLVSVFQWQVVIYFYLAVSVLVAGGMWDLQSLLRRSSLQYWRSSLAGMQDL